MKSPPSHIAAEVKPSGSSPHSILCSGLVQRSVVFPGLIKPSISITDWRYLAADMPRLVYAIVRFGRFTAR